MLVLARKIGEKIIIGDKIEVTVVECSSNCVKIGIDAPKNMSILRKELYSEVKSTITTSKYSTLDDIYELSRLLKK